MLVKPPRVPILSSTPRATGLSARFVIHPHMASIPAIPFLKDLGFPQPASAPGTRLAFKLGKSRVSPTTKNGVVGYLLLAIFVIPLLMLGAMLLAVAIVAIPIAMCITKSRRRIVGWYIGRRQPIELEVSKDPLLPGESFDGVVRFKRPGTAESVKITLVCIEEAKYRRGTDTYTDRHTAFEHVVAQVANPATDELRFTATIPQDAMHSFTASNNNIDWFVRVERIFPGDNIDEQKFLIDVYTAELEMALAQYRQKNPAFGAPLHGGAA